MAQVRLWLALVLGVGITFIILTIGGIYDLRNLLVDSSAEVTVIASGRKPQVCDSFKNVLELAETDINEQEHHERHETVSEQPARLGIFVGDTGWGQTCNKLEILAAALNRKS